MQLPTGSSWLAVIDEAQGELPLERTRRLLGAAWPDEDVDADTPGERNGRLLALRRQLFGTRMDCVAECARCGELLQWTIDLQALVEEHGASLESRVTIDLAGEELAFRLPTMRDVAGALEDDAKEAIERLAKACLIEGDARSLQQDGILDTLSTAFAKADPLGTLLVDLHCPQCGTRGTPALDLGALLWIELGEMADEVTSQVHVLASSYGWGEKEILALSAARRRRYIELVSGS